MRKLKITLICVIILSLMILLSACSDTTTGNRVTHGADVQTFNYGYVKLGNETIVEGYITQWRDYQNGDEIQLLINGKYYLTHYSNVVMIADPAFGGLVSNLESIQDR